MVVKQKFKLHYHSRNDSRGFVTDVIISSRGGHNINIGDVIEVYHPEDAHHALFLVTTLSDDLQNRDVISVEQSLAHTFKLQQHKNVIVNVINKETISLDLVELYFRDQYFSRRDFCNITQKLIGTVVHVNKKLTCNETRTQVGDLWRLGERYSCGYIDSKTKIIFRSSTAVIHIFIQMSQEMWWFDNNGDLYLEKAFKFLSKLFLKFWPENNCNHDTTVVFFTRIYIDDVPSEYSQSFKQDALSRYYEDFYRVIIQNERFTTDDWKRELGRMQYEVLQFENNIYSYLRNTYPLINKNSNKTKLNICTAMDANLLEVLNMAINLYSGYNIDRNFDRTGKLLFVITPGSGVYHVNENLLLLTKKRVLDLGVGVDLICLAEQPLHAVPLFKILSESFINPEEYVAPHWINCSYFKSAQELKYIEMGKPFPRVKVVSFKHSNDVPISTFFENLPRDDRQSDNQQTNVPKENCDDTIPTTTSITITKSSLPIYRIAYPSYQSPSNQNKRKKSHQLPNEVISGNLTKSHDSITSDYCSPSTVRHQLDGNPTHMTSSITDQSSSVESNLMPICCLNHTTQLSANAITAICRSKQAVSTSSSSYKNLSRSYDSYITSNSSITPLVSSTTVNGIDFGITSHNHIVNVDKYLPNNHIPTLLSRVPSISGSNNSGSGSISGYTTITSLPSVRERCIENGQSKSINDKSQILSIPMTPRNSRNRTQSFNGDQRAKLSYVDNHANFREIHNSVNEANYNVNSEGNSVEVAYLHENAISRCRTMDVILSDGQPSSSPWSIITPQHFTLRSCNSIDRRTNGTLSLSGLNSHTLPFIRRKSTITLYTTTTTTITTTSNTTNTNTPIHCGKFNSTTYSRNLTNYATTSLISGAYFPFGVSKNPYRMPISAGQRRWALVRPSDEYGGTITPHCIITSTDDIDFMYPAPLPYNLCQIWTAYFDFLRARFLDKRESNQTSVKDNNKNTDNHNNVNDVHRSIADIQHSSFSKSNAYISVKHLSAYDERPTEKDNLSNDRLPMTFPSISINSNHIPQLQFQDKTTSNSNNHSSTLPISVKLETEHPNHHRNNDNNSLLQTSANSKKALENLLEAIRHTMFSYSIQSSSLSTPYLSSMPSLSSAFWHQNQNITNTTTTTTTTTGSNNNNNSNSNAANNSSDDQKLFSVQMNNFNKLTNYKHMIPKRVDALRNMLRLIGVDWKSLIVPACLPVDTDYFPDTCRLRSEWYTLHDYRVVPSGMSPDEWASMNNDCSEPGALYNRRQLTAREVFQEMVLQRISQGFQLCHEVVVHNPTNSNNVEHHSVTSINTSPNSIIQNDNLTNCSNNKPKTLSVIKQNNDRHTTPNSLHTTYHSRRISNISTTIIDTTTNNNINNSSSYIPTNRNTTNTTQFTKSTNRCLPTRLSSKFPTINNNTQPSRGSSVSSLSSVYNGRVLGVGLTINSSNRSVNQSNCHNSSRPSNNHSNNNNRNSNNRNVTTTIKSINRYKMKKSDNTTTTTTTTTNAMFNSSLSKFGDTDQLLKTTTTRKLSIGHLFHLISLDEDSIGVTSYREIDKLIKITYSYALQVPDAKSYVSLHTNFTSDSTIILNWNYLDNYLCNRGISDSFRLLPNLKFWRSRFFVIPIFSNETRRLAEAIRDNHITGQRIQCDVYESDYLNINREKTCEKFVHFIESINRIRRTPITSRKLNRQSTAEKSDLHRSAPTTTTTATSFNTNILNDTTTISCCKPKNSPLTTVTYTRPSIITPINTTSSLNETSDYNIQLINRGGAINSPSIVHIDNFYSTTSLPNIPGTSYQNTEDQSLPTNSGQVTQNASIFNSSLFSSNTNGTYYLVALMMVDNDNGLPFISATTTDAFPNYTFISIDAVNWIIKWFPDFKTIEQAILYLQQMLEAGWICHTSGNSKHVFIYGTYFYTLLIPDIKQLTNTQIETSFNLSTLDNSEMNIHSAPVTPIQLNISNTNCTSSPSSNTSQSICGLSSSSIFPLTTSTLTTTTSLNTSCYSSTNSTISITNSPYMNSLNANSNLLNNVSASTISTTTTPTTATTTTTTTTNDNNNSCSTPTTTPSTIMSNPINTIISLPSITSSNYTNTITNTSLLPYLKQNDLNYKLINVLQQLPIQFPKDYLPKLLNDTTKWTSVFQNEWAEISIVHYGSNECQIKPPPPSPQQQQQILDPKYMNSSIDNNDSLNEMNSTSNISSSSLSTSTTSTTTTTTTTTTIPVTTNDSCPSLSTSEIQYEHVNELNSFFKDGLLTYTSISTLFGIPDKTGFQEIDQVLRKSCLCDLDGPNNDGPVEWAHCVYDANYYPTCAFSIELQWLVVTGGRMAELVSLWYQKAGTANLHFFPVPCYPFGQSNDDLSDKDPLRKPIFLPVNVDILIEVAKKFYNQSPNVNSSLISESNHTNLFSNMTDLLNCLFPDIPPLERLTCIRFFQDSILRRFGFINDSCVKDRLDYELHGRLAFSSSCFSQKQWIYVHCSGGIFTMIPSYESAEVQGEETTRNCSINTESSGSRKSEESDHNIDHLKDDYRRTINMDTSWISSDCTANCFAIQKSIGYFWSWNHMLPKRWRGHLTGDELFQDGMLADFRAFLNGEDDRLFELFNRFMKTLSTTSQSI